MFISRCHIWPFTLIHKALSVSTAGTRSPLGSCSLTERAGNKLKMTAKCIYVFYKIQAKGMSNGISLSLIPETLVATPVPPDKDDNASQSGKRQQPSLNVLKIRLKADKTYDHVSTLPASFQGCPEA